MSRGDVAPSVIYWDWNATTPPHPDVLEAMRAAGEEGWANPSSQHQLGRAARRLVEGVREQIAALLPAHPRDVVFTSSGTEANNIALRSAPALVVSRLDHPSVIRVAESLEERGTPVRWAAVRESGRLDPADVLGALDALPEAIRSRSLVVVTAANHETGVLQDVSAIAQHVHERGARLHCDASQALGKVPVQVFEGADSWTLSAHKIRGPQGVAVLAWRGEAPGPVLLGGSQERGIRPGTVSAALIAGFGAAVARLDPGRYEELAAIRDAFEAAIDDHAQVNGGGAPRLPHVSNVSFHGWTGERLVAALDVRGICVSTGSACRVGTAEPSAVVRAMLGIERARAALRVSLGEGADDAQLQHVISTLLPLLERQPSSTSGIA